MFRPIRVATISRTTSSRPSRNMVSAPTTTNPIRRPYSTEKVKAPAEFTLAEFGKHIREGRSFDIGEGDLASDADILNAKRQLQSLDETVWPEDPEVAAALGVPAYKREAGWVNPQLWVELFRIAEDLQSSALTYKTFKAWRQYESAVLYLRKEYPWFINGEDLFKDYANAGDLSKLPSVKNGFTETFYGKLFGAQAASLVDKKDFADVDSYLNDTTVAKEVSEQLTRFAQEFKALAGDIEGSIVELERVKDEIQKDRERVNDVTIEEILAEHPEWAAEIAWNQREHKWYEHVVPAEELVAEEDEHHH